MVDYRNHMSGIPSPSLESMRMLSEHIEMDKKVYRELCDTLERTYDALKKLMTLRITYTGSSRKKSTIPMDGLMWS